VLLVCGLSHPERIDHRRLESAVQLRPEFAVMSWDTKFPEPISVSAGSPLLTLKDAGAYITALPLKVHDASLADRHGMLVVGGG
jgi:hypothetical protein